MRERRQFIFLFALYLLLPACKPKIDSTICEKNNVYYSATNHYYLVASKNTSISFFYIRETKNGLFLRIPNIYGSPNDYNDIGPYNTIDEAITDAKKKIIAYYFTWSYYKRSGNTLVKLDDGTLLENLCE